MDYVSQVSINAQFSKLLQTSDLENMVWNGFHLVVSLSFKLCCLKLIFTSIAPCPEQTDWGVLEF